jgi:hypothetical protein
MRTSRSLILPLLLAAVLSPAAIVHAQKPAESPTPEALARVAAEAVKQKDWAKFASLMHPAALAEFKGMFAPLVKLDGAAEMRKMFFGVEDPAQFDALSGEAAFERLMSNLTANVPGVSEALASSEMIIVGSLPEGDDLVHVVYHSGGKTQGIIFSKTAVMSFRRHQGEWRALLSGSLEGLAQRIAAMAGG